MKRYMLFLLLLAPVIAQPTKPADSKPSLGQTTSIALAGIQQRKKDAQAAFSLALQQESAVLAEWKTTHPGWHIDPTRYDVTADTLDSPNIPDGKLSSGKVEKTP